MKAAEVKRELKAAADPAKAAFYPGFFKAGNGEYAEGDRFVGVVVPEQRRVARRFHRLPDNYGPRPDNQDFRGFQFFYSLNKNVGFLEKENRC